MKSSLKRMACFVLAALIFTFMLGCTPAADPAASSAPATTDAPAEVPAPAEQQISLTVGLPSGWLKWGDTEGLLKQYEAEKGVKVEIQAVEDDQFDNLLMAKMATGEGWDVFFRYTGSQALKYTNIADLSDQPWVSRMTAGAVPFCTRDGKIVCAPTGGGVALCIVYNKTLFKELGLSVPETMDEFEAVCETLKGKGVIPMFMGSASGAGWMAAQLVNNVWANIMASNGADTVDKLNKNEIKFSDIPAWMDYLEKWESWGEKGYFNPNMASDDTATGVKLVGEKKCAMILTGDWQASEFAQKYPDIEVGGMVIPVISGSDSYLSLAGPNGIYVSSTSKNVDAAKELVAWLCDKAQLEKYYAAKPDMSVWQDVQAANLNPVAKELTPYMTSGKTNPHWGQFYVIPYAEDMSTMIFQLISGQKTADETAKAWDDYMIKQGKQLGLAGF